MAAVLFGPAVHLLALVACIQRMEPSELGVLNNCALIPAYLSFAHLGVFTGLSRQLPLLLGQGEKESARALEMASSALAWLQGSVLAGGVLSLAVGLWLVGSSGFRSAAMAATAATVLQTVVSSHVDVALRGKGDFKRLSLILWLTHAVNLGTLLFILKYGAWGAVVRLIISGLVGVLVRIVLGGIRIHWRPNWNSWVGLAKVGFPLMVSGALFNLLAVSDRSVVAMLMSDDAAGHFALAGMLLQGFQVVPQSLSMTLFPKMARAYGEHGDVGRLRPFITRNLVFNILTIIPLAWVVHLFVEPIVTSYFPAYVNGVEPAKMACFTAGLWIYLGTGSVFGVTGTMRAYLSVLATSVAVVWVLGGYFILNDYGLMGAAWARFAGTVLIASYTIWAAYRLTLKSGSHDGKTSAA